MSIQRCEYCNKNIDTDFYVEHFDVDIYRCKKEEEDKLEANRRDRDWYDLITM